MPRDIDISLLRAFIAVVDTGSVTGAARLLNRTQAAVSQQIKRLEELFGTELFAREHKRITLALDGERLLAQAQKIVALNDETWGLMTTPSFRGEVRLGVPMDIVAHYTPPILRRFN
ncbi:MAG: LysR family transcriptional regulator, partial [Pseudomonadota bacterium]